MKQVSANSLPPNPLLGVDGQYWPTYRSLLIRCDEPIEKLAQEVKDEVHSSPSGIFPGITKRS